VSLREPGVVEIIDVPDLEVGPEDVLLDIRYVGLCGSDLKAYRGGAANLTYPRIPGHEIAALVKAVGDAVPDSIVVGDRVTVSPYTACGVCPACRQGRKNCCEYNQTLGVQRDGALSRWFSVPYPDVVRSDILTLEELALVEPMSVGYHAANRARVSEIDTVLVIGAGTIGLGVIAAAVRKGATVIVADIDDGKLGIARRFGADVTINTLDEDALEVIGVLTKREGVSVAIEAVGLPDTYRLAVDAVCFAGRVAYVGYAKKPVTYDSTHFVRKELDIVGSRNALHEFPAVVKMIEKREQPFTDLITRVYPFEKAQQAFADWDAAPGKFTKVVVAAEP
jgi:L-galactonate 5-dehydrogenase